MMSNQLLHKTTAAMRPANSSSSAGSLRSIPPKTSTSSRPSQLSSSGSSSASAAPGLPSGTKKFTLWHFILGILLATALFLIIMSYQLVRSHSMGEQQSVHSILEAYRDDVRSSTKVRRDQQQQQQQQQLSLTSSSLSSSGLPLALQSVLDRARHYQSHCQHVVTLEQEQEQQQQHRDQQEQPQLHQHQSRKRKLPVNTSRLTDVDLPAFGIIGALQSYAETAATTPDESDSSNNKKNNNNNIKYEYQCQLPPETECQETQFTVIFMGYNPDRLQMMRHQINAMLHYSDWQKLVHEIVLVWNGPRHINESAVGQKLLQVQASFPTKFRIFYPLQEGFPNDLMNRYHPRFQIRTKAILFYDDDGPFYSYSAVLGGFELWKRNANAEIGAMARKIDISPRQEAEKKGILNGIGDRFFVSHCAGGAGASTTGASDTVVYNYNFFAQFGANMALPSGSFFHSNYLCWIWHPALADLRQFVRDHPVHPDDATVSMIISQLAGRAPKVYSRRIQQPNGNNEDNKANKQRRRGRRKGRRRQLLLQMESEMGNWTHTSTVVASSSSSSSSLFDSFDENWFETVEEEYEQRSWESHVRNGMDPLILQQQHGRKLLWEQQDWGQMRREAVNSLVSYFGSLNSGSIGWCYGTPWQVAGTEECLPDQAKLGMLPWMQPDHTPKTTCP